MEVQLKGQSGTVLEQTTSCDGLVQLMPRKRKAEDGTGYRGGCNGSALVPQSATDPQTVDEDGGDEFSWPDTHPGPSPTPVLDPTPTPAPEIPASPLQEQGPYTQHPEQMQEMKPSTLVTRPTHLDLPPPPELEAPPSLQRSPGPSANHSHQTDITPGLPVLVVDDDKMTRMLFQRMLGRLKCSVTTAVNGYEALQLITGDQNVSQTPAEEQHEPLSFSEGDDHMSIVEKEREKEKEKEKEENESRFAIVFLDNQMPVMSGVEMVRKLRKLGRKDLVVGVTGEFFPPHFHSLPVWITDGWVDVHEDLTMRGLCRERTLT